jgi:hypothetical protein
MARNKLSVEEKEQIAAFVEKRIMKRLEGGAWEKETEPANGGFVYVISMIGLHKIGRTNNISRRLKEFSIFPEKAELVLLVPSKDSVALEDELHGLLAHKRVRGEWFKVDEKDLEWIRNFSIRYEGLKKLPRRPKGV